MRISDWSSDVCSSDLAADGQHLLLAAGKIGAQIPRALLEAGEQAVYPLQGPGFGMALPVVGRGDQVLFYAQIGKYLAAFGYQPHAGAGDFVGWEASTEGGRGGKGG